MRAAALGLLFAAGCSGGTKSTTIVYEGAVGSCPSDRPIQDADLDCICGVSGVIIDTVLAATCDELWCDPVALELTCFAPTTTTPTDSGSSSSTPTDSGSQDTG